MRQSAPKRAKLLGVGPAATRVATETNRALEHSPTRPAIERYTGVLYESLDATTLNATARRRLNSRVLIFSGLWGVVAPDDRIPDYKLKMGANLGRLGKMSTWWRSRLAPSLDEMARGRVVWDLRPKEHGAAWLIGDTPARVITVNFLEERPGRGLVTVSHWNKLLKGVLARNLVSTADPTIDSLADFHFDGFEWEPDSTVERDGCTHTDVVRRIG